MKRYEDKNLLCDVFDAYYYNSEGKLVFMSENLTSSDITGSADEKEVRNGRGNGLFAKLYSNKKIEISLKTNAFDFSTVALLAGTTVGTGKGTCYTPSLIQTVNKDMEVVLPYKPKDADSVEIYHNGNLVENTEYTITENTVLFTSLAENDEVIIMPYEFDMTADMDDEFKEIVVRADQFPTAGKLVLKGVEKNKSAENYRDLTIIIDKAQPASDFSLSTSSEVEPTETEIKLSALVNNGRLMRIIEGKTIDKDNGVFEKIPVKLQDVPCTPTVINNLTVGSTEQLTSTASGVTFTSQEDSIATVNSTGLVEGVKAGKTKIVVSAPGYTSIEVEVEVVD